MARRSKYWTWTLNNPTDDEEQALGDAANQPGVVYLLYGREVGQAGTRHLQGYAVFDCQIRFTTVKNRLSCARLHLEASRGSPQQNRDYCTKDGDFEEFGNLPVLEQGRRTDLESFFAWSDEHARTNGRPPTTPEAARHAPVVVTKYPRIMQTVRLRFDSPPLEEGQPNEWQNELEEELDSDPEDRKVKFYVDPDGGKGKSWFVRYYLSKHPNTTQFLSVGKRDDLACAIKTHTRVFLVDVPREQMEFFQYSVMEQLKNRLVFSPKYNSQTKVMQAVPHVVVFCNEEPDMSRFTEDRWDITHL